MRYRGFAALAAVIVAVLVSSPIGWAARNQVGVSSSSGIQELVVIEAPNCIYCSIFRRDVLPGYQRSKHAAELPIRFLDLNDPAVEKLKLASSVTIVPTIVLMRDNAEAGRISGYTGPEAFFQQVSLLARASD